MILEQVKTLEIEYIGDTEDGYTAGITDESLPFMFEFMSKHLYSNPIGSLIREITSNCFDSHIEAGIEDPVIISKTYHPEEGYSIEFKDVGVGISPERMLTIYMNYFNSSKRGDNIQIGGFGIGSKTPLAYADLFYITTVFGGLEYEYIFHKGELKPTLDSMKGYDYDEEGNRTGPTGEPTDKRNGTVIKINVEAADTDKFRQELKFQLAYFDNVYFKDWNISNNYDIYEGKYYKFRSDADQYHTEVHICLGNVRYVIDKTKVKIPSYMQSAPIAVKFEIGELKVTPSRESLRYVKEDVKKIEERLDLAYEELANLFTRDNPVTDNVNRFIQMQKDAARIVFDKDKGHSLLVWNGARISKSARYAPFVDLPLTAPPNLFFRWKIVGHFNGDKVTFQNYPETLNNDWLRYDHNKYCIVPKGQQLSVYTLIYIQQQARNRDLILIRKEEIKGKDDYNNVISILKLKGKSKLEDKGDDNKLGSKTKAIREYNRIVDAMVRGKVHDYLKEAPSDEWIADYKKSIIESSAAYQRKMNKMVFMRNVVTGGSSVEMKTGDLLKRKGLMIYGFAADRPMLDRIFQTLAGVYNRLARNSNKIMIVQVAMTALGGISHENPNIMYCSNYIKTYQFRKVITMIHLERLINQSHVTYRWSSLYKIISHYLKDFKSDYDILDKMIHKYRAASNHMIKEDIELIPELLVPFYKFEEKYHITLVALHDSLLRHIDSSAIGTIELLVYLKSMHMRLENKFYLKSEETILQEKINRAWKQYCSTFANVLLEIPKTRLLTYSPNTI